MPPSREREPQGFLAWVEAGGAARRGRLVQLAKAALFVAFCVALLWVEMALRHG